jgi:hypothetical protein
MIWLRLAQWLSGIARAWSALIDFGLVLWPLRFVVLVLVAVFAVLQVDQAQDVLFHIFAEGAWAQLFYFVVALIFLALQSWYWSRFLLTERARRQAALRGQSAVPPLTPLEVALPRLLGGLTFWIAAFSVGRCPEGYGSINILLWVALFAIAGPLFVYWTYWRRTNINQRHGIINTYLVVPPPPNGAPPSAIGKAVFFWALALVLSALTALISPWSWIAVHARPFVALVFVVGPLIGSVLLVRSLKLPGGTKRLVIAFSTLNALLFAASVVPTLTVLVGEFLGAGPVLILAGAIWIGTTSFFVAYPGVAFGLPVTTLLLAFMALGTILGETWRYDNHTVRAEAELMTQDKLAQRPTLAQAFDTWRKQAPCGGGRVGMACKDDEVTLVIVASEGGASRAGYWTAMVLGALEDQIEGFHRSVFAISSVSGGSVGTMVYDRLIASFPNPAELPCGKHADSGETGSYARCAQDVMRRDFLGPTFYNMFNADLVQRLLPGAALPDRATALESSWETAWRNVMGAANEERKRNAFAARFPLRDGSETAWRPVLLLNGASVKTGRRIITSDIAIAPDCRADTAADTDAPFLGTIDFFCLTRRPIAVSTAAHNSARFPYVSPAGTLWARNNAGETWKADRIVDGGYFETHGAITALNVASWAARRGYKPIVLALDNDLAGTPPDSGDPATTLAEALGPEATRMGWLMKVSPDALSPPLALVASRSGHGEYATERLKQDTSRIATGNFVRLNIEVGLGDLPKVDPAMSWFLSDRSLASMNGAWCRSQKVVEAKQKIDPNVAGRPLSTRGYQFDEEVDRLGKLLKVPVPLNTKNSPVCRASSASG